MTELLQTTIAGSLPKPAWLAEPKTLWAPWRLEGAALAEGIQDAVRLVLRDQEEAGIDIVTDGEQTRRHFVTTFLEGLDGVDFEHRKTVRIRNRYDASVPVVVGPVARRQPVFVDAARFLRGATAVHICYGYGIKANIDWKKSLGAEWRQYEQTFPLLARSAIRQVSLECANSHVPLELIGLLAGKDVLVGAVDVATERIETPADVAATIRAALRYVPAERLYPCTNCGMVPLPRDVARGKLRALAAGAALVRAEA